MAVITPRGIARTLERRVTEIEATISARMPKSGGSDVGYHDFPNRKSLTETTLKTGTPSMKRKRTIKKRMVIEARAMPKKRERMIRSLCRRSVNSLGFKRSPSSESKYSSL
jgi:hypothetical protein